MQEEKTNGHPRLGEPQLPGSEVLAHPQLPVQMLEATRSSYHH